MSVTNVDDVLMRIRCVSDESDSGWCLVFAGVSAVGEVVRRLIVEVVCDVGIDRDVNRHGAIEYALKCINHVWFQVRLEDIAGEFIRCGDRDRLAVDELRNRQRNEGTLLRRHTVVVGKCLESLVPHLADVEGVLHSADGLSLLISEGLMPFRPTGSHVC